jgi:hypothetical protein
MKAAKGSAGIVIKIQNDEFTFNEIEGSNCEVAECN